MAGVLLAIHYQYQRIQYLSSQSSKLSQSNQFLQDQLQQTDAQFALLSTALQEHQQQLKLEEKHAKALAQHPCAAIPVPESVIRLQRNTLKNADRKVHSDDPGTFADATPGTEL